MYKKALKSFASRNNKKAPKIHEFQSWIFGAFSRENYQGYKIISDQNLPLDCKIYFFKSAKQKVYPPCEYGDAQLSFEKWDLLLRKSKWHPVTANKSKLLIDLIRNGLTILFTKKMGYAKNT